MARTDLNRRNLLIGTGAVALAARTAAQAAPDVPAVHPVPMDRVRLKPSIFAAAQQANRTYLASLAPDRLLHRFHAGAGLPPKAPVYGGWESQSISGHSLGHYLTACALTVANSADPLLRDRLSYTVAELARVQAAHGDGYVGGSTTWGQTDRIDGKSIYEQLRKGVVRATGFSLNDGWVPLYTLHKIHAGLIAAHQLAGTPLALDVAIALSDYFATILDGLSDAQVQQMLVSEHGGLNDSFAELYSITGNPRWLATAQRLCHKAVLDPLAEGRDELAGLHANTQIPKVIGLARLHAITGRPRDAAAARFFHETVTNRHSYVIGGNSDREHFGKPGRIAAHISETTCEACNSYNMLKLTRHLYAAQPDARWFDQYERTQLNHIMAHQRPDDGSFVYFMPLASGARRSYSTPEDSFWCCVGSGIESHAKHSDSIYWRSADTLYVNLYIPSELDDPDSLALDLNTRFPDDGSIRLTIRRAPLHPVTLALRLPGWSPQPRLALNGRPLSPTIRNHYAELRRRWTAGDTIDLTLAMPLRAEPVPDDPALVAFLSGPLVLAADLGPAAAPFRGAAPALVSDSAPAAKLKPLAGQPHHFSATSASGEALRFQPFFAQYDQRTAVYLPTFTSARWASEGSAYLAAEAQRIDLANRTADTLNLGEQQPEVDHQLTPGATERIQLNGRSGRRIQPGQSLAFIIRRPPGDALLRFTLWAEDQKGSVDVSVDGIMIGTIRPAGPREAAFRAHDLALPAMRPGRDSIRVDLAANAEPLAIYDVASIATRQSPD